MVYNKCICERLNSVGRLKPQFPQNKLKTVRFRSARWNVYRRLYAMHIEYMCENECVCVCVIDTHVLLTTTTTCTIEVWLGGCQTQANEFGRLFRANAFQNCRTQQWIKDTSCKGCPALNKSVGVGDGSRGGVGHGQHVSNGLSLAFCRSKVMRSRLGLCGIIWVYFW